MIREESLFEILSRLSEKVDSSKPKNIVNVDRGDILDGAFRAFKRKTFYGQRLLNVRFTGEDGIDNGGLTREFLRLSVSAIEQLNCFEGEEHRKFIALDYNGLSIDYIRALILFIHRIFLFDYLTIAI